MGAQSSAEHWDQIYQARPSPQLGWYEPRPSTLGLVIAYSKPTDAVIDVGGGDSHLVDELVDRSYGDVTVLDVSDVALSRSRSRLAGRTKGISWIRADVTKFTPQRTWDLWHDRAVFHFLLEKDQTDAYRAVARRSLAPDGRLVVATFSLDGPERCAGLPVAHYGVDSLVAAFAPDFEPMSVQPITRASSADGDQRPYVGGVFRVS